MVFPPSFSQDYPSADLVGNYTRHVTTELRELIEHTPDALSVWEQASRAIGRSCVTISTQADNSQKLEDNIEDAEAWLELVPDWDIGLHAETVAARHVILPFLRPWSETAEPDASESVIRRSVHETIIRALDFYDHDLEELLLAKKDISETLGIVTQLTTLGLLTRYAHPQLLAMPALSHQNANPNHTLKHQNYDVVLIEADKVHKVQIKTVCLGYCAPPWLEMKDGAADIVKVKEANRRQKDRELQQASMRERYAPDIALISGCCDLRIRGKSDTIHRPITKQLIEELDGTISDSALRRLDSCSNGLMLNATSVDERRGTFGQ